jgi:anti-sigma factor RsiW
MTSSEFQGRIDPFLDNEVDLATAQEMQRHLEECAACETFFAARLALRHCLQNPKLRFAAPDALRRKVRAQVRKEIRSYWVRCNWLPQLSNWILPTLAGAVAVLICWFSSSTFLSQAPSSNGANNSLIEQLVSNHLRSLTENHLFDVASSDQHTVKPWFAGKINFTPPVFDFSEQGFKLIGGRLDYLGSDEVAAVVFQHRKHYINLFVWPRNQSSPLTDRVLQKHGFNLCGWEADGLTLWAVSDAAPETLKTFVELEKQRIAE